MGKLNILSHSSEPFSGRIEAGKLLSRELKKFLGKKAVVLGIPRGGLVTAREIADELKADLDIVLSRKIGAPFNPEFALGAITEDGEFFLNEEIKDRIDVKDKYIEEEKARQMAEIARRVEAYRKVRPKIPLKDRIAIITDDGVATGATMQAAIWAARKEGPKELIVALPVGPEESIRRLARDADETICLRTPPFFEAVGQFYSGFSQVSDEEVLSILKEAHEKEEKI